MKKSNLFILALALLLASCPAFMKAQKKLKVGIDAGLSQSILDADLSNFIDTKYEVGNGFTTRLSVEYNVYKELVVGSGLSFVQKAYKYKRTNNSEGIQTSYRNNFIQIPLTVGAYLINNPHHSDGIWIKLSGGAYYEYLTSIHRKGSYLVFAELGMDDTFAVAKVSEKYDFKKNENNFRRGFFGLQASAEAGYSFGKYDVLAAYTYQHGLTDIYKSRSAGIKKSTRNSHFFTLGVAYKF